MNLYIYCSNNPIIFIDPSGHNTEEDMQWMFEYTYFEYMDSGSFSAPNIRGNINKFNDADYDPSSVKAASYQETANCYLFSIFLDVEYVINNSFLNATGITSTPSHYIFTSTAPGDLANHYDKTQPYFNDIKVFQSIKDNNNLSVGNYNDLLATLLVTFEYNIKLDCNTLNMDIQRYIRGDAILEGYHKVALMINPNNFADFHFIIEGSDNIWYSKNGYDLVTAFDSNGHQVIDPLLADYYDGNSQYTLLGYFQVSNTYNGDLYD